MRKIAASVTVIGLSLCLVIVADAKGGGGGHGGGGGGGHFGGGGAHFGGGGGGMHFGGGGAHFAAPHFSGRVGGVSHFAGRAAPHFSAGYAHVGGPAMHAAVRGHAAPALGHATAAGARFARGAHAGFAGPRAFAAHRQFAANGAFRPFLGWGWHPFHHIGWVGPWFWPYAFGDFFYYALWPDDYWYYDPFWVYGYGDIYEGIFSPYLYDEYVQGPGAPARMTALTQHIAQSCTDEAAEVTGWPIDQIEGAVQPSQQQGALLDDLGNAIVQAGDEIKSNCPTSVSFTPTGRLDDMQQRLQALVQAVNLISPPLDKFYDSLSDEQKARFNGIGTNAPGARHAANASNPPNPQTQCDASVMAWPTDQINNVVQPNDAQRAKLEALQSAAADAANTIKAACPSDIPSTPPARLDAVGKHLQAMLQAVDTLRVPLHDFYDSLSDSQKARFNTMGRQLFAAK